MQPGALLGGDVKSNPYRIQTIRPVAGLMRLMLRLHNISLEMVEQAYCSCRRTGFRFQVTVHVDILVILVLLV